MAEWLVGLAGLRAVPPAGYPPRTPCVAFLDPLAPPLLPS